MFEIDREAFGAFLSQLRREKGLTQKELAGRLYVSDKAVSKWERGLSLPDIALLTPLAEELGVTVTELLRARRLEETALPVEEVEELVTGSLELSDAQRGARRRDRRRRGGALALCGGAALAELLLLHLIGVPWTQLWNDLGLVEGLCLFFGGWLCLFTPDVLPAYYDENDIRAYSDGVFRLNLGGIRISNRNWPYLLRAGRRWLLAVPVLFPLVYLALRLLAPQVWALGRLWITLGAVLGFFVPMVVQAKRYA